MSLAIVLSCIGERPQEWRSVKSGVGFDAGQRQGGRAKVDKADNPGIPAAGILAIWMPHDQGHSGAGIKTRPFAAGQANAVVTEKNDDRLPQQVGLLEFPQPLTDPGIHFCDVVVGAGDGITHVWRVGIKRRERHILRGNHLWPPLGLRESLTFVRAGVIEHRKEGLTFRPVLPVGLATRLIPNSHGFFELIVLL